eukprot:2797592-Lingulodinium_polyedra.AAC.1
MAGPGPKPRGQRGASHWGQQGGACLFKGPCCIAGPRAGPRAACGGRCIAPGLGSKHWGGSPSIRQHRGARPQAAPGERSTGRRGSWGHWDRLWGVAPSQLLYVGVQFAGRPGWWGARLFRRPPRALQLPWELWRPRLQEECPHRRGADLLKAASPGLPYVLLVQMRDAQLPEEAPQRLYAVV